MGLQYLYHCYCGASVPVQLLLWGDSTCTTACHRYCGALEAIQLLFWAKRSCRTGIEPLVPVPRYCGASVPVQLLLWGDSTCTTACHRYCGALEAIQLLFWAKRSCRTGIEPLVPVPRYCGPSVSVQLLFLRNASEQHTEDTSVKRRYVFLFFRPVSSDYYRLLQGTED